MTNTELGLTIALAFLVLAFAAYDMHVQTRFNQLKADYDAALAACQPKRK